MALKFIVRHGLMRFMGEFEAPEEQSYPRGAQVVVRTERGLEVGEVLCESTSRALEFISEPTQGRIQRQATKEDLTEFRNELPGLASVLKLRSGRVLLTLDETVARSGLSEDLVLRINRAAGFPDPEPGARLFSERQADLLATFASAERVFGRDAII